MQYEHVPEKDIGPKGGYIFLGNLNCWGKWLSPLFLLFLIVLRVNKIIVTNGVSGYGYLASLLRYMLSFQIIMNWFTLFYYCLANKNK
jgi:hypothetical protein